MGRDRRNSKAFYTARGMIVFIWFFIIYKLTSFITSLSAERVNSRDASIFAGLPEYVVYITISVSAIFIFNSVSLMFSTFDIDEINSFIESDTDAVALKSEIKRIFTAPHILAELITTLTLISLTALLGGFYEIGSIFFDGSHRGGWFPLVIITPICLLLFISAKYEARRYWFHLNKTGELERVTKPSSFYKRFALVFFLYPLVFPYSPLLAFFAISFATIILSIFGALTVAGIIIVAISSLLFVFVIPMLKRGRSKAKLTKSINETASREGYEVKWHEDTSEKNITKFDLFFGEKEFNCLIIGTKRRRVPLIFTSATNAYFEHRIGTREHHISINRQIDFFLHGKGTKIIILNPCPKHVFVTDGIKMQRLSYSDRIWNQILHDDVSFIGAMDRKCLDRYSLTNE